MSPRTIRVFSDYKSPYAYLAKDPTYELERDTGAKVEWLPYTLDIPAYLGSASVDAGGFPFLLNSVQLAAAFARQECDEIFGIGAAFIEHRREHGGAFDIELALPEAFEYAVVV